MGSTSAQRAQEQLEVSARAARIVEVADESVSIDDALVILANTELEPAVRRGVLMRSDLPPSAIELALVDRDDSVRAFALGLLAVPAARACSLEADPAWQVRSELARREDCPVEVLERLAEDPDAIVRRSALAHRGVGAAVLIRVLTSGHSRLDAELAAGHPSLDMDRDACQLFTANAFGAMSLLKRSDLPDVLVARFVQGPYPVPVRVAAVRHDACPSRVQGEAAADDVAREVRQAAAAKTTCPERALLVAAGDREPEVRRVVASNPSSPPAAIRMLLQDADELVRRDAAKSGHGDPILLADLVWGDPDVKVRRAALANPLCPSSVVDAACGDPDLVFTAAGNPARTVEGSFAALMTIRFMPRQTGKGEPDAEQRQRDRVRNVAKKAVKDLEKQDWVWLQGHSLELLNPMDLEVLIGRHLFEAVSDAREAVRMAVASHRKSDVTVLMALSADASEAVRKAVSARILDAVDGSL